jgi:hypothetical protein
MTVAELLMPIFSSTETALTSFGFPSLPFSLTQILGTIKSESPFVPSGGASSGERILVRALNRSPNGSPRGRLPYLPD